MFGADLYSQETRYVALTPGSVFTNHSKYNSSYDFILENIDNIDDSESEADNTLNKQTLTKEEIETINKQLEDFT